MPVVPVVGEESREEAAPLDEQNDAILLDAGNPALAPKELGGSGRRRHRTLSRRIREPITIPVFLAGGLKPDQVRQEVDEVGTLRARHLYGCAQRWKAGGTKTARLFYESGRPLRLRWATYSPYGTQMFFTWVECSRNQRPSACFELNQSMARPSFVHTCFRLPVDIAFAAATMPSSP